MTKQRASELWPVLRWQVAPVPKDYWLVGDRVYLSPRCKPSEQVIYAGKPIHVREVLP